MLKGTIGPPSILTEYGLNEEAVKLRVGMSLADRDRCTGAKQAISLVTWMPAGVISGASGWLSEPKDSIPLRLRSSRCFW
jgi:hypothetical protein